MVNGIYVTVVGGDFFKESKRLQVGEIVRFVKDYENEYDDEAIAVEMIGIGQVGYVANSTNTVARGTKSAGRIYDTFDDYSYGIVRFILKGNAIVKLLDYHEYLLQYEQYMIKTSFFTPKQ